MCSKRINDNYNSNCSLGPTLVPHIDLCEADAMSLSLNFLRRAFILAAWIASRGSQAYRERRRLGTHVEIYFW